MAGGRKRRPGFLAAAVICFAISATAFGGVILRLDATGRAVFGIVWAALGVIWLGSYFGAFFGTTGKPPKETGES